MERSDEKEEPATIKREKSTIKKYNLIYRSKYCIYIYFFFEYYNINFNSLSLTPKYQCLASFYNEFNKFPSINPWKENKKNKKEIKRV